MSLTRPVTKIRMPATTKELAAMLEEASRTARKLPPAGPRGYASIWPQIPRSASEKFAADDKPVFFPPSGAAIDRMLACFEWVSALDEEQRHLLWKRANHEPWKDICAWMGCDRTTGWRRWNGALEAILAGTSSNWRSAQVGPMTSRRGLVKAALHDNGVPVAVQKTT